MASAGIQQELIWDAAAVRRSDAEVGPEPEIVVRGDLPEPRAVSRPGFSGRLSREQVIDEIMTRNPSACIDFLEAFEDARLRLYLDRLRSTGADRGRGAVWERAADSPAILWRERDV